MPRKTATYHGIVHQGHPSGPTNTPVTSYDKRYFGKEHYDTIVAAAKDLLKEDWLKHSWDGGAEDAPIRAALDLAIHVADGSLFQSKIDAETYEMLLNRLAGWKHDQFAETVLPQKADGANRSASAMSKINVEKFLRIASELRQTNPRQAIEIVKAVRAMRAAGESVGQTQIQAQPEGAEHVSQQQEQAQQQEQSQQQEQAQQQGYGQQEQQSQGVSDKDMDAFVEGKLDIKDLKDKTKKLVDAKDVEDFIAGLKDLSEVMKKTAAGRRIAAGMLELAPLEDMNEEEVKAFLEAQKGAAKELSKALESDDIEAFMKGLDEMFAASEDAAKHVKTSSVRVSISTLVRLAHSVPATRSALLPIIAAAKKKKDKKDKKKPAKTSGKDKKEETAAAKKEKGKKPPFGGKKAPPFGKKGPAKKKASTDSSIDADW